MRSVLLPVLLTALAWAQTPNQPAPNHPVTVPSFQGVKPMLITPPPPPKGPGTDSYQLPCKTPAMARDAVPFYQAEMTKQGFVVIHSENNDRFAVVTMTKDSQNLVVTLNAYKMAPRPAFTLGVSTKGRL